MLFLFLVISIIGVIYSPWFTSLSLSAGDWPYLLLDNIRDFSWIQEARFLWLAPYYQIGAKIMVEIVGMPWDVAEKVLWFFPFIIVSILASYRAFRSWIAVLVYTTNTYILMIVGGGQMGVAMAYALAPWVFHRPTFFSVVIQMMFDPRIALLTILASIFVTKPDVKRLSFILLGAVIVHLYWIIPVFRSPSIVGEHLSQVSTGILDFLSFATFSQTISLLHPNWPENIFGKVYFMQPEFLIVPLLAFSVFLFGDAKAKREALPFGLLALVGAFLAKGTQEPIGGIYQWLFENIPGFWLFRDSTKFYLFIALAYSYLISKSRIPAVISVLLWAVLIRQAVTHDLGGTFKPIPVDPEYIRLKELTQTLPEGQSTYWMPAISRYAFYSTSHPAISGQVGQSGLVVVPIDSRREMFLTEREYDESKRLEWVASMSAIPNLERDPSFERLAVWTIQ